MLKSGRRRCRLDPERRHRHSRRGKNRIMGRLLGRAGWGRMWH
jgi:hypothetical protein